MAGGSTIVEFWRERDAEPEGSSASNDPLKATSGVENDELILIEADSPPEQTRTLSYILGCIAILWVGLALWSTISNGSWSAGIAAWPAIISTMLIPLVLLGMAYMILSRGSRSETMRYLAAARLLRQESDLLESRLQHVTTHLNTARQSVQDQAAILDDYGAVATSNMSATAQLIVERSQIIADRSEVAERAGSSVVSRMDSLIAALPDFEARANSIAIKLDDNGRALSERIDTLEARLHSLTELSEDARTRTAEASKSLSVQLTALQEATRATTHEINGLAESTTASISTSMEGASNAMAEGRRQIDSQIAVLQTLMGKARADIHETSRLAVHSFSEELETVEGSLRKRIGGILSDSRETLNFTGDTLSKQSESLDALIERARRDIASISGETVADIVEQVGRIENHIGKLGSLVIGQRELVGSLHENITNVVDSAESRFSTLETNGLARGTRLTEALSRMTAEAERIDAALAAGGITAEKLISFAEGLMVALDSSVRELDETFPLALDRLDSRLAVTKAQLDKTKPELEHLEAISDALLGRTQESDELIRGQGQRLSEWLESTKEHFETNLSLVAQLRETLDSAYQDSTRLTEGAGPLLITALLRVKDTADQAAERARQALGRAIPEAAQALADASQQALQKAMQDEVTTQITHVAQVAEDAVKAAHQASDRLMRQLLTIADTSATVEQRIEQAQQMAAEGNRDLFSQRSAALIEALNNTAIDITKILSSQVSDISWAAYLKGDQGVFTRNAVRLLTEDDTTTILERYDIDPSFREHVARYIHDFEAMLRHILTGRDGNSLAVTLLSSDMGKLYVALAQAIERLQQ